MICSFGCHRIASGTVANGGVGGERRRRPDGLRVARPIRPELLDELTERYRRVGIEDSNPLNEITERTRAALERELGIPVHTGMRHWRPRIAEAVERALDGGAATI